MAVGSVGPQDPAVALLRPPVSRIRGNFFFRGLSVVPGRIGSHPQLAGEEAISDGCQQSHSQDDTYSQRLQRSARVGFTAVFEQEGEPAEQADQHADEQHDDEHFQHLRIESPEAG